jgi:hypothetical protein
MLYSTAIWKPYKVVVNDLTHHQVESYINTNELLTNRSLLSFPRYSLTVESYFYHVYNFDHDLNLIYYSRERNIVIGQPNKIAKYFFPTSAIQSSSYTWESSNNLTLSKFVYISPNPTRSLVPIADIPLDIPWDSDSFEYRLIGPSNYFLTGITCSFNNVNTFVVEYNNTYSIVPGTITQEVFVTGVGNIPTSDFTIKLYIYDKCTNDVYEIETYTVIMSTGIQTVYENSKWELKALFRR